MKTYFAQMLAYEKWANDRLIGTMLPIETRPERADAVMSHLLAVQKVWYNRATEIAETPPIWPYIDPAEWLATNAEHYRHWTDFLDKATPETLSRLVEYSNSSGTRYVSPITDILLQVSHHAAYHRGQIMQLIRPQLDKPPLLDYIFWRREV